MDTQLKREIPTCEPGAVITDGADASASLHHWIAPGARDGLPDTNVAVDCGWGQVLPGQTYRSHDALLRALTDEAPGARNVALYVREPQVLVATAPQDVFLDPSLTLRLDLHGALSRSADDRGGPVVRPATAADEPSINRVLAARSMVPLRAGYLESLAADSGVTLLVAHGSGDSRIQGLVMGIDHATAFRDPERGSSLWSLAVDPQAEIPGLGRMLVERLAGDMREKGLRYLDLSVMHDNEEALSLYRQLGFEVVPAYCLKCKNSFNAALYMTPAESDPLNPYAEIIIREARRRGIRVEVEDAMAGLFRLVHAGRAVSCRESLSDFTSAVGLARCDDKALTTRLLRRAGLRTPPQQEITSERQAAAFLREHGPVVMKPARGEQGAFVFVNLESEADVIDAFAELTRVTERILIEKYMVGEEMRIVVINDEVVAAAIRRPPVIRGDGKLTAGELIDKLSRRRRTATGGESEIPPDNETCRCLHMAGYDLEDIIPEGESVVVRQTANLHTGGTLHDVTDALDPTLTHVALEAAKALEIPVVGLDLIVDMNDPGRYSIIEANERPGLANHEPRPTAERFVDMLFPETVTPS